MPLDDLIWAQGRSLAEMPSQQELAARLQALGRDLLTMLQKSGHADEL